MRELQFDVLTGDCLDVLQNTPDNSVDLIVTSPPYAMQRNNAYGGCLPDQYSQWFIPRADQMMRALKPTGSFILNIKEHTENGCRHPYVIRLALSLIDAGWNWIDTFCWVKTNNGVPGGFAHRLKNAWEPCYHFCPTIKPAMYVDQCMQPLSESTKNKVEKAQTRIAKNMEIGEIKTGNNSSFLNHISDKRLSSLEFSRPSNVINADSGKSKWHPASFSLDLPKFFIKLFTLENDVVLDPFAGSGATLLAANSLCRRAIGIEIIADYADRIVRPLPKLL